MRIDSNIEALGVQMPDDRQPRPLQGLSGDAGAIGAPETSETTEGFSTALHRALVAVNDSQQSADRQLELVATGQAENLHDAVIAIEEADLTLRLTAQVTQRAVEAYQEISRMQL